MKTWMSAPPTECDLCQCKIKKTFIDGATRMGPWACMCPTCHKSEGRGLGLGKGQEYKFTDGKWVMTRGS